MSTAPKDIARLWFEVTEQVWDEELFEYFTSKAAQSPTLRSADRDVIALAGRQVFLRSNSLMTPAWEEQVLRIQGALARFQGSASAREHHLGFLDWWPRRDAIAALDRLHQHDQVMGALARSYTPTTVRLARKLLTERALNGETDHGDGVLRPLRYRPHLHYPEDESLPVISVDTVEMVILHLLSLTYPSLQFFYDKHGQPVPGFLNGYHGADRPGAVCGMSLILDAVADIVEEHRHGSGGRIYVSDRRVACPAHRHNIARIDLG